MYFGQKKDVEPLDSKYTAQPMNIVGCVLFCKYWADHKLS